MRRLLLVAISLVFGGAVGFSAGVLHLPPYNFLKSVIYPSGNAKAAMESYGACKKSIYEASTASADVIMLGDSITDNGEWAELFPNARILNRGISGQTTSDMLGRLDEIISRKPKKVLILCGINDLASEVSPREVCGNIAKIVGILQSHKIRPVVQSIFFVRDSFKMGLNKKVQTTNEMLADWCKKHAVIFIDLNSRLSQNNQLLGSVTNDGLHLNGQGYIVWAEMIRESVAH